MRRSRRSSGSSGHARGVGGEVDGLRIPLQPGHDPREEGGPAAGREQVAGPDLLLGETSPRRGIEREIPRLPVSHGGKIPSDIRGFGGSDCAEHRRAVRIAIDIDSTLHHHWPLVAAAAKRRFGVELPYEQQFPSAGRRLSEEQLRVCIEDTHTDEAIAGARPYPHAVETVNGWYDAGHSIHITSHRAERSLTATRRWLDDIGLRHHELCCGDDKVARCRADRHRAAHRRQPGHPPARPRRRHPRGHAPPPLERARVRRAGRHLRRRLAGARPRPRAGPRRLTGRSVTTARCGARSPAARSGCR